MEKKSSGESSSSTNGVTDPMHRLPSFRSPRDLTLGGIKVNKKVFAPNLNISRNKGKGPEVKTSVKKEGNHHKEKDHHRRENYRKNGPNIIQSSGIFSEGMAAADRRSGSLGISGGGGGGMGGSGRGGGGGRGGSNAAVLQKPIIRPSDVIKVDNHLEDECIRRAMDDDLAAAYDDSKDSMRHDLPVKLPIADFQRLNFQSKHNMTHMPNIKTEPGSESVMVNEDVKPLIDEKADLFEEKDIVTLLQTKQPTLILMQLPESMPGRGDGEDDARPNGEDTEARKCRLKSLAEGRIGKLCVHRSGRVRLWLGDANFEVISGTKAMHYQEVVSVATNPATRSARISAIGALQHKVTVIPDWDTLLQPNP